jgi:hypothetical protein
MPAVDFVVYTLKGRSLNAAKTYYKMQEELYETGTTADWDSKTAQERRDIRKNFSDNLRQNHPDIIEALGMNQTAVQVRSYRKGQPRAYTARPECYAAIPERDQFYIYSHVDYKGNHFVPPDAVLQTEKEAELIGGMLWAGGWSTPIMVVPQSRHGIALPADFNAKTHQTLKQSHLGDNPKRPYRFFMAGGAALATLNQLEQDKEVYSQRITQLFDAIKNLTPTLVHENAIPGITAAKDVYFNSSLSTDTNGRPVPRISPRRDGSGEPLPLASNSAFTALPAGHHDYVIVPNLTSALGQALQAALDAIPENPASAGFPAKLLNTDNVVAADKLDGAFGPLNQPLIRHFREGIVLAYRVNRGKSNNTFTPAGCTEITQAAFLWMENDQNDRNAGCLPPPTKKNIPPVPKP